MPDKLYITTPLYYVNDEPHIGHAYTTILADVIARYQRLFHGEGTVHFLTGLDEHGQKVAGAASRSGKDPQKHCDEMAELWKGVWKSLNIEYDDFIRTTEERHVKVVVDILNQLYEKGDIYSREYEGWYSVFEERFFTEKDLVDGKDPIGGRPVERIKESNYFFRMSKYQGWLVEHYEKHPDSVIPKFRLNEVKGFLRQPLDDLCISRPRSRLAWGIPIPWDHDYVTYVWFDALINYYSATVAPPDGKAVSWPADYHLIGKDILTTHAVYWPIMLHAAGREPPRHILAHGWWLTAGEAKMSKSSGATVKPLDLVARYGPDAFRYFLMREMVVGQDASFSEEAFIQRVNADLANDLGNLYSRLAKLWHQFRLDRIPLTERGKMEDYIDPELTVYIRNLEERVRLEMDDLCPHAAIEEIMRVVRGLNRQLEIWEPWKTGSEEPAGTARALSYAWEALEMAARLLDPVMPDKMSELRSWVKSPQPGKQLFPRIQPESRELEGESQEPKAQSPEPRAEVTIDDFSRLDLRVGVVTEAKRVEGSDNLLVMEVNLGDCSRQIVAALAKSHHPDELIGRRIVLVVNLKPVKLRGVLSHGMLLAAGEGDELGLITIDRDVPPGSRVR